MKINKYFSSLAAAIIMMSGLTFTSCADEPDKFELTSGKPEIQYIRTADIASADSLLTEAYMEASLCIVGNNLTSIKEMWFNDQQAVLNTTYMTDHTLIVAIPKDIPKEVNDLITMTTKDGDTVTYPFHVIVPGPSLSAMSYEYAPVGSEVTLVGDYFIEDPNVPLTVTFPGNVPVTDIREITKTSIRLIVPDGATTEGAIKVATIYGNVESKFHYLESRGIMFDFDGLTGLSYHGWHSANVTTDETAITGNFVQFGNGAVMSDDGGWDDSNFAFEYWPGSWNDPVDYPEREGIRLFDLIPISKPGDMVLKFDMNIPASNPWMAGAMQIVFAGTDKVTLNGGVDIYGNTVAGANNTYFRTKADGGYDIPRALYRPWTTTGSYDTGGEWITVSLPVETSFTYNFDGSSVSFNLSREDCASFLIFIVGGGVNGTECHPIIKVDNIRLVPNK